MGRYFTRRKVRRPANINKIKNFRDKSCYEYADKIHFYCNYFIFDQ